MDDLNKNGNGTGTENGGATGKKPKKGFVGAVKSGAKSLWVWLTTSKAGKVTLGIGAIAGTGLAAKAGYDKGFLKGAASVTPTTVYITTGDDSDDDDPEPEEDQNEVAEETAE